SAGPLCVIAGQTLRKSFPHREAERQSLSDLRALEVGQPLAPADVRTPQLVLSDQMYMDRAPQLTLPSTQAALGSLVQPASSFDTCDERRTLAGPARQGQRSGV